MADVPVKFTLSSVRPDQRIYRQQEIELVCVQELEVLVPLTNEYIANSEEVIQSKLASGNVPITTNPILTVAGLKYVIDQFDAVFLKEEKKAETKDEENWEEEDTAKPAPAKPAAVVEEDWDNDDKKPEEVPWDESTEEWN